MNIKVYKNLATIVQFTRKIAAAAAAAAAAGHFSGFKINIIVCINM